MASWFDGNAKPFSVPSPSYLQSGLRAFYYCENDVSEHLHNSLHCSSFDFCLGDECDLCDALQRENSSTLFS